MKIIIPLHSFVDLITNSSSEVYVYADSSTVEAARELIEALFNQAAYPGLKATDFFDISLEDSDTGKQLVVTPKNPNDPKQLAVANALHKLVSSISAEEVYNG